MWKDSKSNDHAGFQVLGVARSSIDAAFHLCMFLTKPKTLVTMGVSEFHEK